MEMSFWALASMHRRLAANALLWLLPMILMGCRGLAGYPSASNGASDARADGKGVDGARSDGQREAAPSCGPATCGGCCAPDGACKVGTSVDSCGKGGAACRGCVQSLMACTTPACVDQECSDQPVSDGTQCNKGLCYQGSCCTGCHDGMSCLAGDSISSCGWAGGPCVHCVPSPCFDVSCNGGTCGEAPMASGSPCTESSTGLPGTCDGGTCCTGCMDGNNGCVAGDTTVACGIDGQQCKICTGPKDVCFAGACVPQSTLCGACSAGCCETSSQKCLPPPAQDAQRCGVSSVVCAPCGLNKICKDGRCVWALLGCQASCLQGCCTPGGGCVTTPLQTDEVCGRLGNTCQSCVPPKQCCAGTCKSGVCP